MLCAAAVAAGRGLEKAVASTLLVVLVASPVIVPLRLTGLLVLPDLATLGVGEVEVTRLLLVVRLVGQAASQVAEGVEVVHPLMAPMVVTAAQGHVARSG